MKLGLPSVSNGLSTDTVAIKVAGVHSVLVRTTVLQPSAIVITISQSGSATASFVTPATSPQQGDVEMNAKFNCAVGDILTVAITSASSADLPPSLIKSVISIKQGV